MTSVTFRFSSCHKCDITLVKLVVTDISTEKLSLKSGFANREILSLYFRDLLTTVKYYRYTFEIR